MEVLPNAAEQGGQAARVVEIFHQVVATRPEVGDYLDFRERCASAGIDTMIVPGILPITKFPQLQRFAEQCGASVPGWLAERFEGLEDDAETRQLIAASVAIEQVRLLQKEGIEEFHFYTLNRAELTYAIRHALPVRQEPAAA